MTEPLSSETDVLDDLTLMILAALAAGRTPREAAADCNVSEATLERRLLSARRSWDLENTTELVVAAVRRGLI